jgi:Na+-transporting methylmalonyl-CoA/oxaloacetate decarboxylase gamma subunit
MLTNSLLLTLIGMSVVFAFLVILIGAMNLNFLIVKLFPEQEETVNAAASGSDREKVALAIALAHHQRQGK